jgi:hypothetical protein
MKQGRIEGLKMAIGKKSGGFEIHTILSLKFWIEL